LHEFLTSKRYGNQNAVAQDFVAEFDPNGKETVGDIIKKIQDQIVHMGWDARRTMHSSSMRLPRARQSLIGLIFGTRVFGHGCLLSMMGFEILGGGPNGTVFCITSLLS
jgi:hypothetical protein